MHLDKPTEEGEKVIRILTNLPAAQTAQEVAELYRRRWTIERMFQWLEAVLHSEVRMLGYPRAALLAFAVAVVAFNVLSAIQGAIERQHGIAVDDPAGVSFYYLANEIKISYRGMMIAVPSKAWQDYNNLEAGEFSRLFLEIAKHVNPRKLRKHPRGPKKVVKKGYAPGHVARRHVATARVLAGRRPA